MNPPLTSCPKPLINVIAATAAALALTACGGGGSSGFAFPVSQAPAPATASAAPALALGATQTPPGGTQNPSGGPSGNGSTNTAPVSNAGAAQSAVTGKAFKLDGSASTDADGDTLTYAWTLTTKPATSAATLATTNIAKPDFSADVAGDYVFSLVVNDGKVDGTASTVAITVLKATYLDADCSISDTGLSGCGYDFSDNDASVTVVQESGAPAVQLATGSSPLAETYSTHTGIKGNRAILGTEILHLMPLKDFPGISFKAKDDGTSGGSAGLPYVTYSINKSCNDMNPMADVDWANLITNLSDMAPSAPDAQGYRTYTADTLPSSTAWKNSSYSTALKASDNTTVVLRENGAATGGSLAALLQAYPNACIYNWPNDSAVPKNSSTTPAVMLMLGNSKNENTAKQSWFKDLKIGGKSLF